MTLYSSYDEEPDDIFLPLSPMQYRQFYDLEMSRFTEDLLFYSSTLPAHSTVLELGCGSGRLTHQLTLAGHDLTGIDLSYEMLYSARQLTHGNERYACMDMRQLALHLRFGAIIIPYNTLNLLTSADDIKRCLNGCSHHLQTDGLLLLQLYITPEELRHKPGTTNFQFQIFDRPAGGKVIKEILRTYLAKNRTIQMEERYRVRPMSPGQLNKNHSHTLHLCGWDADQWLSRIKHAGFFLEATYGDYTLSSSYNSSSNMLLVAARKQ